MCKECSVCNDASTDWLEYDAVADRRKVEPTAAADRAKDKAQRNLLACPDLTARRHPYML
jgi:exonuclease VII large subunit